MDLKRRIRDQAQRLGFKLCGFTPLQSPPHGDFVRRWVAEGNAGTMSYIGRGLRKRLDPTRISPAARSVITVGLPYRPLRPPAVDWRAELRGRIAAYAYGPDYHDVVLAKLERLAGALRELGGTAAKAYVDTGPVLEREWAYLAGIGWFGKNTTILHRQEGSWFLLGEIFTDLELDPEPVVADHCGTCRRCLELCPTGALKDGYVLDARLCISYLTIEYRGVIPHELRPRMGEWIFGCDVCQDVCPWNDDNGDGQRLAGDLYPYLPELLVLDAEGYRHRFGASAVSRAKRDCFVRNVAIVLGNTRSPRAVRHLAGSLEDDPSPLVRAHAAWALGQIDDAAARRALDRAWVGEVDDSVRAEIRCVRNE
jgi:epoxyqueuosine reductase